METIYIEEPFYNKPLTLCISKNYTEFVDFILKEWATKDDILEWDNNLWQPIHIPWIWWYIYLAEVNDIYTIIHELTHITRKMWEYIGHWTGWEEEYYTYAMEYYCKKIFEKFFEIKLKEKSSL